MLWKDRFGENQNRAFGRAVQHRQIIRVAGQRSQRHVRETLPDFANEVDPVRGVRHAHIRDDQTNVTALLEHVKCLRGRAQRNRVMPVRFDVTVQQLE